MSKKGNYKVPFDIWGNLMSYPQNQYLGMAPYKPGDKIILVRSWRDGKDEWKSVDISKLKEGTWKVRDNGFLMLEPEWRANEMFMCRMTYIGYSRGRSATDLSFQDEKGHEYSMFISEFDRLLKDKGLNGKETGHLAWKFVKKGANYSLCLA